MTKNRQYGPRSSQANSLSRPLDKLLRGPSCLSKELTMLPLQAIRISDLLSQADDLASGLEQNTMNVRKAARDDKVVWARSECLAATATARKLATLYDKLHDELA